MTREELREALAYKLAWVFGQHHSWDVEEVNRAVGRDTLFKMADECIRQMEWARVTSPIDESRDDCSLTLAPEDWKP